MRRRAEDRPGDRKEGRSLRPLGARGRRAVDSFIGYTGDDSSKLPMCFDPHHAIVARSATNRVDGYDGSLEWSGMPPAVSPRMRL